VYLIRHGVSRHNHHNIALTSPSLWDASLDTVGLHQAVAIGARYRHCIGEMYANKDRSMKPLELIVSSPLTRCLETAHLAFSMGCPLPPPPIDKKEYADLKKLARSEGKSTVKIPAPQNHPAAPPKFVCNDDLREAHGVFFPDRRREVSKLEPAFPNVEFVGFKSDEDDLWDAEQRESLSEVNRRISSFFEWLAKRPEKNIAVITHGVWMEECLRR
jgi:broad specificity phosphatase PhoE